MTPATDKVFDDALSLPVDDRLNLVERLLTSLNLPLDPDIERAWIEEVDRRLAEIESGKAKTVPADEVFARIRSKFGR